MATAEGGVMTSVFIPIAPVRPIRERVFGAARRMVDERHRRKEDAVEFESAEYCGLEPGKS